MITLGQQLNLPKLQCYLDYMGAFDDLDQLGIATSEVMPLLNVADDETEVNPHFGKVKYHTLTAKSDWQFAPSWNLQLKGMYGITTVCNSELLHNYRRSYGYVGTLEYFPVKKKTSVCSFPMQVASTTTHVAARSPITTPTVWSWV